MSGLRGVLVVDDHVVFAEALSVVLGRAGHFGPGRWAQTAQEALESIASDPPEIAVVDYRMPDVQGAAFIQRVTDQAPALPVLVLSVASDARSIMSVFEAGARGFLGKHEPFETVIAAARACIAGENPISASAFSVLLPKLLSTDAGLTPQEERILVLLGTSASNEDIAEHLCITYNTVRNHVSNLLRKLGAENRHEAVRMARNAGLIPPAPDD